MHWACAQSALSEGECSASKVMEPEELVANTFHALFPNGFEGILPVRKHRVRAAAAYVHVTTMVSRGGEHSKSPFSSASHGSDTSRTACLVCCLRMIFSFMSVT